MNSLAAPARTNPNSAPSTGVETFDEVDGAVPVLVCKLACRIRGTEGEDVKGVSLRA